MFSVQPRLNAKDDVIWGFANEDYYYEEQAHAPQAMAWGAISYHGKTSLVWVEDYQEYGTKGGGYDAEAYIAVLEDVRAELEQRAGRGWWLQQDGATPHTAEITQEYLREEKFLFIPKEDWPPNSPDLSPIEDVWGVMDHRLKIARPKTLGELKEIVTQIWDGIAPAVCQKMIDSIPSRLAEVRRRGGAYTKH